MTVNKHQRPRRRASPDAPAGAEGLKEKISIRDLDFYYGEPAR